MVREVECTKHHAPRLSESRGADFAHLGPFRRQIDIAQKLSDRVAGLSAHFEPVGHAVTIKLECGRVGAGIIVAEVLNELPIARGPLVGRHHTI